MSKEAQYICNVWEEDRYLQGPQYMIHKKQQFSSVQGSNEDPINPLSVNFDFDEFLKYEESYGKEKLHELLLEYVSMPLIKDILQDYKQYKKQIKTTTT